MRWIQQNDWHPLNGFDEHYRHAKFGEDRTTRAGCRCENIVFVWFFLFFCHAPRPVHCSFEGCIVWTRIVCSCEIADMLWGIPYFRPRSLSSRKEAAGESKYPD